MAGEIEEPLRFDFQADHVHSGSISFGRFESESLSWERRSSFSHNRYLEEVEKYSKPGSVTEKKAYFEAHFRKKALLKQNLSESQDEKESPTSEHNDLDDLQESKTFFNEETKIQTPVNKNIETLSESTSEPNSSSLITHTPEKDKDMVTMVKPTSEMKQQKPKLKAHDVNSVKAKTKETKSLHMKEKEKKPPQPATPITHSVRKTLKSEESSMSFLKAKVLPLNKSIVKEYKSLKPMETKSLMLEKKSANRIKQTTMTPSVNKGSTGFTFRSDQRAEKRKEEKRVADMAQTRKTHNFKATPMPSFYKESIRPSSSPSLANKNQQKKKELTFQRKPTKGQRVLKKEVKGVDLVNGPKHGYLAIGVAI
ncbi:unnamed protein product [Lactuca virosa]|uniref:TPX2 C-terminal domain-containing protein n=1 Tax=Lactuca virosa TaxID=75947 RepID=A0AAU9LXY8_9ASTR|nr:unnamed protein product [Lactuca virosa]CAH1420460.1 unnamed protein product [Lactuca virosa]